MENQLPPVEPQPERSNVIPFRLPGSSASRPTSTLSPANRLTQADLEELETLRDAYRKVKQALRECEDRVAWHLLNDTPVEPGPRSARLRVCNRPPKTIRGASYYRLLAR